MATPISRDILDQETDARFWAQTGYKPGQKLDPQNPTDKAMASVWLDIFNKVKREADAGTLVTTYDHPEVAQNLSDAAVANKAASMHVDMAASAPNATAAQQNVGYAAAAQQISTQKSRDAASKQPPTVNPEIVKDASQEAAKNPPPPQASSSDHIAHEHAHRHAHAHAQAVHAEAEAAKASSPPLAALYKETNSRFWSSTHYKPGVNLDMSDPQDAKMAKTWMHIFHQVQAEAAAGTLALTGPEPAPSPMPPAPPPPTPVPSTSAPSTVAPPATPPMALPARPPMAPPPMYPRPPMQPYPYPPPGSRPPMQPYPPGRPPMGPPPGGQPPMGPDGHMRDHDRREHERGRDHERGQGRGRGRGQPPATGPVGPQPSGPPSPGAPSPGGPGAPSEAAPAESAETPTPAPDTTPTPSPEEPSSSGIGKYLAIGIAVIAGGGLLYYATTHKSSSKPSQRSRSRARAPKPLVTTSPPRLSPGHEFPARAPRAFPPPRAPGP